MEGTTVTPRTPSLPPAMPMTLDLRTLMAALENVSDLELLQLRTAVAHLLASPQRVLAIRQRLNTGLPIEYWSTRDQRMHRGRIAQFKSDRVLIHHEAGGHVWVEYAALVSDGLPAVPATAARPTLTRADFQPGDTVGFEGRDLIQHIGTIVRMNPKTASVACPGGEWRVSYALLHRVVEV